MDPNKLAELQKIEYQIPGNCGICQHGEMSRTNFGTCRLYRYQHARHSGEKRQLSIYAYGRCNKFVLDEDKAQLGLWREFVR
jgi:hypothetical protein